MMSNEQYIERIRKLEDGRHIFHGGCLDCTKQRDVGIEVCGEFGILHKEFGYTAKQALNETNKEE